MALELLGGSFLSSAFDKLFERLFSMDFKSFIFKRKIDGRLVDKLRKNLEDLQEVLDDAQNKQISNKRVKNWLDNLQHVVYQAEDLLEEIATKALKDKLEADHDQSRPHKRLRGSASISDYLSDEAIEFKMKDIINKLESFVEEKKSLNLREIVGRKQLPRQETTSLVDESYVYGRNNDKEKIMELLFSDSATRNQIPVISIVGMGGMGKTTLAQLVYNDSKVDQNFDMKVWVCVSDEFDVLLVTKRIVEAVKTPAIDNKNKDLNQLQIKLKKSLAGKKFLLVLDDVWHDNSLDWENLKKPFTAGAQESRIIVTTRSDNVARVMGTICSHHLKKLSSEDCWSLFAKLAFVNVNYVAHPELEKIGRKIVKKCDGLPLAIRLLGGILQSTLDIDEWEYILKSELWNLKVSNILPALRLSYYYLPSHLKRCFAYCSTFPKDYEFEKEKLVQLWIAIDLVKQPKNNMLLEDEGKYYFRELLSRSFFQRLNHDTDSFFVMHDLIHDLAEQISGDFGFRLEDGKPLNHICEKVRDFSYAQDKFDAFEKFKAVNEFKCLRTFMPFSIFESEHFLGNKVLHDMLPTLRCLKVLCLSEYQISELPQSIENLILLRHLDLSCTKIRQLPDSITTLCNLRTLDLSYCFDLIELPLNIGKLMKLCHLDIRETRLTEMPMQMSRLKNLQHLTYFVVGKDGGSRISVLKELCQLRGQLHISQLQNVSSGLDASEANLKGKEHLEGLKLEWGDDTNDSEEESDEWSGDTNDSELEWGGDTSNSEKEEDVLDKLQPHAGVKDLHIIKYGGTRFPDWLERAHLFGDMVSLDLIDCANCSSLPAIGQLLSLKNLRIEGMKAIRKVGQEFYRNASSSSWIKPFQCLETLSFEGLSEWEEWHALGAEEFSQLLELSVIDCPKLRSELSIHFPSLRKLEISNNEGLVSNKVRLLLQGLPVVQKLKISAMTKLTELPQELQHLSSLQKLEISNVPNLKELPQQLQHLYSLQKLEISNVPNLKELPQQLQHLSSLQELKISGMPNLKELPQELCRLVNLERLKIEGCGRLVSFPDVGLPPMLKTLEIERCEGLQSLAAAAAVASSEESRLEVLRISQCSSLVEVSLPTIATLKTFSISFCRRLEFPLLSEEHNYHMTCSIEDLRIVESCDLLKSLWFSFFPKLRSLYIGGCINLETLTVEDCPKMVSFPHGDGRLSNLTELEISNCKILKSLPQRMHTLLPSLQSLFIKDCPEVESFPDGGLPSNLSRLEIVNCEKLMKGRMGWGLQQTSLEEFIISGKYEEQVLESFPEEWLLPTTLTFLRITNLPDLKAVNHKGLQHLTSLQRLFIWDCPKLKSLPEEGLPNSLSYLSIWDCPLLKPRCQREKGEDWSKISPIRHIRIDNEEDIVNLE